MTHRRDRSVVRTMFLVAAAMVSAWLITVANLSAELTAMLQPFLGNQTLLLIVIMIITMAVGNPPILLPLQILYLNLLMHTFPALGLTLERADPEVMKRAPLPLRASLLPEVHASLLGVALGAQSLQVRVVVRPAVSEWNNVVGHGGRCRAASSQAMHAQRMRAQPAQPTAHACITAQPRRQASTRRHARHPGQGGCTDARLERGDHRRKEPAKDLPAGESTSVEETRNEKARRMAGLPYWFGGSFPPPREG
jgi:hypothetical protein